LTIDNDTATPSSGNIYADLEYANPGEMLTKAGLVRLLSRGIKSGVLTCRQAAELLQMNESQLLALVRGHFEQYSMEELEGFVAVFAAPQVGSFWTHYKNFQIIYCVNLVCGPADFLPNEKPVLVAKCLSGEADSISFFSTPTGFCHFSLPPTDRPGVRMVVYSELMDNTPYYCRSVDDFMGLTDDGNPRFQFLETLD
jgi:predicted XRE-type DNA-binding protein